MNAGLGEDEIDQRLVQGAREHRKRLFDAVDTLSDTVGLPRSVKDAGVLETDFLPALPEVTMAAYSDVTRRTNPRMPMLAAIEQMFRAAFERPLPEGAYRLGGP